MRDNRRRFGHDRIYCSRVGSRHRLRSGTGVRDLHPGWTVAASGGCRYRCGGSEPLPTPRIIEPGRFLGRGLPPSARPPGGLFFQTTFHRLHYMAGTVDRPASRSRSRCTRNSGGPFWCSATTVCDLQSRHFPSAKYYSFGRLCRPSISWSSSVKAPSPAGSSISLLIFGSKTATTELTSGSQLFRLGPGRYFPRPFTLRRANFNPHSAAASS